MKLTKLHVAGFKTFVETTDFQIEPGLTGVVGPNGCGKSNLVEAMRWVMGENSSKSMRATGMDDVIFSGSGQRPARNVAEVALTLDNSDRTAPAAFNDAEMLEVSRRIERESGSTYRINGREVRARDVQILFADAATGARSPAMVRQGQIGEIISAKPQARRRILEEAAGVAGLHARRHEAEIRLKAAEENLLRLDDVLKQIDAQSEALKRQARQAARYKGLAGDIRRHQALLALIQHRNATQGLADAEQKLDADQRDVTERTRAQAEAARLQAIAAYELPPLREAETDASGALQKLIVARETLDGEERRAKARLAEIERRVAQMAGDLARETTAIDDAAAVLDRLVAEQSELESAGQNDAASQAAAREVLAQAEAALSTAEKNLQDVQSMRAQVEAQRGAHERIVREEAQRMARLAAERTKIENDRAALERSATQGESLDDLAATLEAGLAAVGEADAKAMSAEEAHGTARAAEERLRGPVADADRKAQRLETEVATLTKLLSAGTGGFWPAVTEEISVAKGYEAALGAALGDDLDASTNPSAPAHWALTDAGSDPSLPPGVESLGSLVEAPPALQRSLAQIGIVLRGDAPHLRTLLKPGQRLVSKEGDLWRWDGFTQAAEAPTAAARRLAEKNRLGDLRLEATAARHAADALRREAEAARTRLQAAAAAESAARQAQREARRNVETARDRQMAAERRRNEVAARLSALEEAALRLAESHAEATEKHARAAADLAALDPLTELTARLERARATAAQERAASSEARIALQTLVREAEARAKRLAAIADENTSWQTRRERATAQIEEVGSRLAEAKEEQQKLADAPDEFWGPGAHSSRGSRRRRTPGATRPMPAAAAETRLTETDRQARAALDAMGAAREAKARSEARLEAAREQLDAIVRDIAADLDCEPHQLAAQTKSEDGEDLPAVEAIARKLEGLKQDRERLGAVNLRAEEELNEIDASKTGLAAEHADLTEAIRRLRGAVASLNKEGRERLLGAFSIVNEHFKTLFTTLFNGGTAELQLVESDDPLEAGLEILARPPGKKPQTMTLLSGGEQALTAMALIFAVFLTNPSPICVLDEVDAPLDDANVERFCDLLQEMRKRTDTRFVAITHNPITMARMDRLFGVTMAERGVSQLVSVDLAAAERFLEAS